MNWVMSKLSSFDFIFQRRHTVPPAPFDDHLTLHGWCQSNFLPLTIDNKVVVSLFLLLLPIVIGQQDDPGQGRPAWLQIWLRLKWLWWLRNNKSFGKKSFWRSYSMLKIWPSFRRFLSSFFGMKFGVILDAKHVR